MPILISKGNRPFSLSHLSSIPVIDIIVSITTLPSLMSNVQMISNIPVIPVHSDLCVSFGGLGSDAEECQPENSVRGMQQPSRMPKSFGLGWKSALVWDARELTALI